MYVNVHVYITYFICMFKGGNVCFEEIQILEQICGICVRVCMHAFNFYYILFIYLCICAYVPQHHCRHKRSTCERSLLLYTMKFSGIELGSSGLAASTFTS